MTSSKLNHPTQAIPYVEFEDIHLIDTFAGFSLSRYVDKAEILSIQAFLEHQFNTDEIKLEIHSLTCYIPKHIMTAIHDNLVNISQDGKAQAIENTLPTFQPWLIVHDTLFILPKLNINQCKALFNIDDSSQKITLTMQIPISDDMFIPIDVTQCENKNYSPSNNIFEDEIPF